MRARRLEASLVSPPLVLRAALLLLVAAGTAAVPALGYEVHVNCGSEDYLAQDGTLFVADRAYTPGSFGYIGGFDQFTWHVIGDTPDQPLYQWNRIYQTEYRFDVPNGDYLVTLHMSDNHKHSTGECQFDVRIEGQAALSNIDLYALVWRTYAIDFTLRATVADGVLNVQFQPDFGFAAISAISVVSRAPDLIAPAPPAGLVAADNYEAVALDWANGPEDDLAGYQVERSSNPGGPFTTVSGTLERVSRRLDPRTPGGPFYYRVRAVDAYGNISGPSGVVSAMSLAQNATSLPLVQIVIHPDTLEVLDDNPDPQPPDPDRYVQLDVAFDNTLYTDAIGRYRGNVSRSLLKKSWKIKLNSGLYAGRDNFNLNSEYIDRSLLRERISYQLFARNGCPTPRSRFVHLILNGQWMGVRNDIENVDVEFLERVGLSTVNANMYKPQGPPAPASNLSPLPTVQHYMAAYEKELGDPGDYSDLIAFINGLNYTSSDSLFRFVATRMHLNRLADFYATQVVLQNTDLTFKNWLLHHDLTTDRWTVVPFDVDLTFGNVWPFSNVFACNETVFLGSGNRLFRLIQDVPVLRQLHFDRVRQILTTTFTGQATDGLIDSAYAEVEADAERDWWKWGWESNDFFHDGPAELRTFVSCRTNHLFGEIAPLDAPPALCVNELMASNATTITDEWGDHDDWIELLNRSGAPVSLLGLYLTDDLAVPGRFALPDTTLLPGQRVLVWADNEPFEGKWHAPFKLEKKGEAVGIFSGALATSAPVDVRVFDRQLTDASYGRLPDGSPYWQILATPTPGSANAGGGNLRPQIDDVVHFPPAPPANADVRVTASFWDDGSLAVTQLKYDAGAGYVTMTMYDDGLHGDGDAGDGNYGAVDSGATLADHGPLLPAGGGQPGRAHRRSRGRAPRHLQLHHGLRASAALPERVHGRRTRPRIQDEHGDYDDWVELYNAGPDTLELGGKHLTDNLTNPTKWIFPAVALPPGEFLLVWCDSQPLQGPLHATFNAVAPPGSNSASSIRSRSASASSTRSASATDRRRVLRAPPRRRAMASSSCVRHPEPRTAPVTGSSHREPPPACSRSAVPIRTRSTRVPCSSSSCRRRGRSGRASTMCAAGGCGCSPRRRLFPSACTGSPGTGETSAATRSPAAFTGFASRRRSAPATSGPCCSAKTGLQAPSRTSPAHESLFLGARTRGCTLYLRLATGAGRAESHTAIVDFPSRKIQRTLRFSWIK